MTPCTLLILLLIVAAYLSGAVPWGLIIVRRLKRVDIRHLGSGNIGATNVRRFAGTPAALLVLLLDMSKGFFPILVIRWLASPACDIQWQLPGALAALAAIAGHMFPLYLMFRPSGKGVATALGCFLVLSPWAALAALIVFCAVAALSRKVSLGSLSAAIALLPAMWISTHDWHLTTAALIGSGLIHLRHRENIQRLLQGTEPPLKKRSNGG